MSYANMSLEEKVRYLLMASYTSKDIKALTGFSKNWVYKVMNDCKAIGGVIPNRPTAITSESYWRYNGTSREAELRLIKIMEGFNEDVS